MLAATRNRQGIEERKIVRVDVLGEALRRVTSMRLRTPQVEALLCQSHHRIDGNDAIGLFEVIITALRDELNLVTQVGETIIDRGRRQHEHLRTSVSPDHLVHQARVTIRARPGHTPIAEVVALIDDNQIECPPLQVFQVDVPTLATATRQVRVVQHLVGESVRSQGITFIARLRPQRPVLTQALRTQYQYVLVELLVVLNDGERFECLAQADAVGDDAAVILFQLTNRPDNGVLLKIVELTPDHRLEKTGIFTWIVILVLQEEPPKDVVQGQEIDELRSVLCVESLHLVSNLLSDITGLCIIGPHGLECRHEKFNLCLGLIPRTMGHHRQRIRTTLNSQSLKGEGGTLSRQQMGTHSGILDDVTGRQLKHVLALHGAERHLLPQPGCTRPRESTLVELVAQREFQGRVSERFFSLPLRTSRDIKLRCPRDPSHVLNKRRFTEQKTHGVEAFKLLAQLSEGEQAEMRADNRQFRLVIEVGTQGVYQAFALGVVENLHGPCPSPSCRDAH